MPPQEVLTKDSVTITVDAVVYYRVFDPVLSVNKVANAQYSTRLLAATSLRNILGTKTLQEILTDKDSIAHHMQELLDRATDEWGVKVERVELKDVRLPQQLQRAMVLYCFYCLTTWKNISSNFLMEIGKDTFFVIFSFSRNFWESTEETLKLKEWRHMMWFFFFFSLLNMMIIYWKSML